MSMYAELMETFKTDLEENRGYTEEEALRISKNLGDEFVSEMIDDLWTNWSENFPVKPKGE